MLQSVMVKETWVSWARIDSATNDGKANFRPVAASGDRGRAGETIASIAQVLGSTQEKSGVDLPLLRTARRPGGAPRPQRFHLSVRERKYNIHFYAIWLRGKKPVKFAGEIAADVPRDVVQKGHRAIRSDAGYPPAMSHTPARREPEPGRKRCYGKYW